MEWKLPEADPPVWSAEFHRDRPRARHLEQDGHGDRLRTAARFAIACHGKDDALTFSDLGCGDGGLLSLVKGVFPKSWGYDFCPANAAGWAERGVHAELLDVFGDDWEAVDVGEVCAMTEVLEHLQNPHQALAWVRTRAKWLVCSSPWGETGASHAPEHAWAWDEAGYYDMIEAAGWSIGEQVRVGPFQVVLAR